MQGTKYSENVDIQDDDHALCFCYEGKGNWIFWSFPLSENDSEIYVNDIQLRLSRKSAVSVHILCDGAALFVFAEHLKEHFQHMENKNKNSCLNNKRFFLPVFEKVVLKVVNIHIEKVFELNRMMQLVEKIPCNGYLSQKVQETIADKDAEIQRKHQYFIDIYEVERTG